jgi:hypothetical protein
MLFSQKELQLTTYEVVLFNWYRTFNQPGRARLVTSGDTWQSPRKCHDTNGHQDRHQDRPTQSAFSHNCEKLIERVAADVLSH